MIWWGRSRGQELAKPQAWGCPCIPLFFQAISSKLSQTHVLCLSPWSLFVCLWGPCFHLPLILFGFIFELLLLQECLYFVFSLKFLIKYQVLPILDVLKFVGTYVVAVFCRTLFTIKIISGILYVGLYSFLRLEFQNFILYNHVNWIKFLTCLGGRIIREKLPLVFCQNLCLFLLCIFLCSNLILLDCFGIMGM